MRAHQTTRWLRTRTCLIAGAVTCLACTESTDDPPQSADPDWQLVEDLRLDANAENLSVIPEVVVGPQGEIIVPQPQDHRVRIYDSTGTQIAAVGRRGEGPGEFEHLAYVHLVGDTMVVYDGEMMRATHFLRDGTPARTEPLRFWAPDFSPGRPDTSFFGFVPAGIDDQGAGLGGAYVRTNESSEMVMLRVLRDGTPRIVGSPPQFHDERWSVTVSGLNNPVPFTFQLRIDVARDGSRFLYATADQWTLDATYDLTMLGAPTGDTVFVRSYPYDAEPIPDSAMDRGIAEMVPENELARRFRALGRARAPVVYPPIDVTLGLDGTVWVELRSPDPGRRVEVIDEAGDPIGTLHLPPRSKIQQASRTHVWVTERDPLDLASVVRYRVVRPQ